MTTASFLASVDTNCWIEAAEKAGSPSDLLVRSAKRWGLVLVSSQHSLHELELGAPKYGDGALLLAREHGTIPYFPIGTIAELIGPISGLSGTFEDLRANEALREDLGDLAKSGTDLHDRGALIDSLRAGARYFVTYDKGVVGPAPRQRIETRLSILVRTPSELVAELRIATDGAG